MAIITRSASRKSAEKNSDNSSGSKRRSMGDDSSAAKRQKGDEVEDNLESAPFDADVTDVPADFSTYNSAHSEEVDEFDEYDDDDCMAVLSSFESSQLSSREHF
ncbi:hypothetical protein BJV82DRAFT_583473 [Fennellomyces sp. T-0311]|nr:hypothetical protein BJV82DRAFT_583473 [Fennellomyces sp. T-0311]